MRTTILLLTLTLCACSTDDKSTPTPDRDTGTDVLEDDTLVVDAAAQDTTEDLVDDTATPDAPDAGDTELADTPEMIDVPDATEEPACAPPNDELLLEDPIGSFATSVQCYASCAESDDPDTAECMAICMWNPWRVSRDCVACYAEYNACWWDGCSQYCERRPNSPECSLCRIESRTCRADFEACAGIEPPLYEPDDED